jgi:cell division protease FtsH
VKKIVTAQYERAKAIIEENRDTMIRLAECLLERESLDGVEIRRIVAGLPLDENPSGRFRQRRGSAAVEGADRETAQAEFCHR